MKLTLLLFITLFAMSMNTHSQDLSNHRWEDRLVLILTEDTSNTTYLDQIEELYSDRQGLEDRKLVIYTVLPDKFKRDGSESQEWIHSGDLYDEFKKSEKSFEVQLIGLDGGVKLRQSEFLSNDELFGRIDQMPMRQREIENQKGNDY